MNYPKISIVTPSYNQAPYLEETIRSVLDQNYPNLEYVVIDGGSTDGSVEIIKKYADKLSYWVSEKDGGQYEAINKGFSHTSGEILGWVNSSDIYYPWTLQTIAEVFEQIKEAQWISGMPTNLAQGTAPQKISVGKERNIYDIIRGDYRWIQQESIFWKRELWEKAGGQLDTRIRYAGDLKLWLDFFKFTELYYVNTILGGFRYHDVRRGGEVGGAYVTEAAALYKEYKATANSRLRRRAALVNLMIRRKGLLRKVFNKLKLFSWYKHYNILYDFYDNHWFVRKG